MTKGKPTARGARPQAANVPRGAIQAELPNLDVIRALMRSLDKAIDALAHVAAGSGRPTSQARVGMDSQRAGLTAAVLDLPTITLDADGMLTVVCAVMRDFGKVPDEIPIGADMVWHGVGVADNDRIGKAFRFPDIKATAERAGFRFKSTFNNGLVIADTDTMGDVRDVMMTGLAGAQ